MWIWNRTVDSAINKLLNITKELELIAAQASREAGKQNDKIAEAQVKRNEADEERDRANRIREKLVALVE